MFASGNQADEGEPLGGSSWRYRFDRIEDGDDGPRAVFTFVGRQEDGPAGDG
jgi:hypothetical protein